jgi:hypothetical protein
MTAPLTEADLAAMAEALVDTAPPLPLAAKVAIRAGLGPYFANRQPVKTRRGGRRPRAA